MPNRARRFRAIAGAVFYALVCAAVFATGCLYGWGGRSPIIKKLLNPFENHPSAQQAFKTRSQTILVLGCDQDVYFQSQFVMKHKARADMIMVARFDFEHNRITGVSIPRDTWCNLPEYPGDHRINSYYHNAPPGQEASETRRAVESLIGVKIDRVLVVDYDAFTRLVDLMGGIWVNVPKQLDYDDNAGKLHIHLKPGRQLLKGYDAMCYVRYRHSNEGDADTDFQRQDRQKDFMIGFKQGVWENKFRLPESVEASKQVVGNSFTDDQIIALAMFAKRVSPKNIKLGMVPTVPEGKGLRLESERLGPILREFGLETAERQDPSSHR